MTELKFSLKYKIFMRSTNWLHDTKAWFMLRKPRVFLDKFIINAALNKFPASLITTSTQSCDFGPCPEPAELSLGSMFGWHIPVGFIKWSVNNKTRNLQHYLECVLLLSVQHVSAWWWLAIKTKTCCTLQTKVLSKYSCNCDWHLIFHPCTHHL